MKDLGFAVAPGTHTLVGVQQRKVIIRKYLLSKFSSIVLIFLKDSIIPHMLFMYMSL